MASGDVVVQLHTIMPPAISGATFGVRTGGSTPAEQVPYYAFDAASDQYLDFYCSLEKYGGGGLTFRVRSLADTATTGGALVALAIRRVGDDIEDVDTAQTYDYNEVRIPAPSAAGEYTYDTITFTNGADMDNLTNAEEFILRLRRRGSDNTAGTGDDMAGFWCWLSLIGLET
jgi:hypothetical protein